MVGGAEVDSRVDGLIASVRNKVNVARGELAMDEAYFRRGRGEKHVLWKHGSECLLKLGCIADTTHIGV